MNIETSLSKIRPDLLITDVSKWSKGQWLDFRVNGLGCSEIGSVLGYNKYQEPAIVFAQKLGIIPTGSVDNEAMFMGRVLEPIIANLWEFYDPDDGTWSMTSINLEMGARVREVFKPEIYAQNPKYPWLFGGPDGLFVHDGDLAVLEIKTIAKFASDQYQSGIPTSYIFQIHGYMMLFETDYAEIAMLQDGRTLNVIPIERSPKVVEMILNECGEFWHRLEKARELYEMDGDWQQFEPKPTSSKAYEEFLVDRFKAENNSIKEISDQCQYWVDKYQSFRDKESADSERKRFYANKIKYFMGEATELIGSIGANVSWREGKRGRSFRITSHK